MPDRTPTHRYRSPSYSRSGAATRYRRGRRRLATLLATVVLLAVGGVTAWALVGDRQAGTTAADTTSGAGQDGDGPDTAAIVEPSASPSPSADASESASPNDSAGTFTGTYVPILMYHRIEETTDTSTNAKYYSSPTKFRRQMRALYLEGYTAVTLQQVWDYWHDEGTLPAKPIVLTFDDGTSGQVENTLPVLEKYGWPGVISVVVPNVSDAGGSLSISPDQIRRLLDAGWELDSHSMTHPDMTTVSAARLQYELTESRRRLQEQFGVPCNFFCYPGGANDATVRAAAEAAGYLGATTVVRGCADPEMPYELDRIEVDGRNVIKTFLRDLHYWEEHP
ncbi:MAG: polysaccharide deacetylase family protein [Actinobacteria bacterium]|nr:polysaccharide deacetylase family protein [Actinomycetota bacterium]